MKPSFARLLAVLALTGCLPEGGPPAGTRLAEDRHVLGARFLPGPDGRLLFARRTGFRELYPNGDVRPVSELWAVPPGGGPSARLLEGVDWEWGQPTDSLGRLWVLRMGALDFTSGQQSHELTRVDAGGVQTSLGRVDEFRMSPGGTRAYYRRGGQQIVRELDDREIPVNAAYTSRFVGEAFAFQRDTELWVLPAGQTQPVLLAADIVGWRENPAAPGLQFALLTGDSKLGPSGRNGEPPPTPPRTLRLVAGVFSRALLEGDFASAPVFAPGDDRVAIVERVPGTGTLRLHVFHIASDDHQVVDLGAVEQRTDGFRSSEEVRVSFRPGSAEIWCLLPDSVRVVRPDGSVLAASEHGLFWDAFRAPLDSPNYFPEAPFGGNYPAGDLFDAGGQLWLYVMGRSGIYLGRADDPRAPGLLLEARSDAPTATFRVVPGGRRLLMTWAPEGQAKDWNVTLVDPDTNTRRLLATSVGTSLVGPRRLLTLANESAGLFDLRLIDLDTGEDRLLAQNVTTFTTPSCTGCDPTAPGAPVAFVVHARVPFKYDGLWRVELP